MQTPGAAGVLLPNAGELLCQLRNSCGAGAVGAAQIVKGFMLVDSLERADGIARDSDCVSATKRAVGGMADTDVRVLAGEDHLVNSKRAEPGVEIGAVERSVGALGAEELAAVRTGLELVDDLCTGRA